MDKWNEGILHAIRSPANSDLHTQFYCTVDIRYSVRGIWDETTVKRFELKPQLRRRITQ